MMSSALVVYVQALRAPTPGMIYGEPGMPTGAPQASIILRDAAQAPSLTSYLASVSQVNPTYAALRQAALSGGGEPSPVLRANLERARAIPAEGRFILVDAAAAKLFMYENGRAVDSMKVIVGKPQYATPMIASRIHYATLNPYWHMPDHLVRDLVAANVVKQGLNYLKARGYEVVSEYSENAEVLSPASVDWKAVAAGTATRQDPPAARREQFDGLGQVLVRQWRGDLPPRHPRQGAVRQGRAHAEQWLRAAGRCAQAGAVADGDRAERGVVAPRAARPAAQGGADLHHLSDRQPERRSADLCR